MEKKPYQVGATPLLLDGERAEPGDIVELTDKEAAGLAGHVSPAPSVISAAAAAILSESAVEPEKSSEPEKSAEPEKPAEPATPKKGVKA